MSSSKMFLAGVVGLAAGLAIGVMFAPAKGSKTRKRLKKKLMSIADMYENEYFHNMEDMQEDENEMDAAPAEEHASQEK